jgi:hypothetical protein
VANKPAAQRIEPRDTTTTKEFTMRIITTVAAALVATLALTACAASPEHMSGDAAPAGAAATSPSTTPSATPSTAPSTPSAAPSSTASKEPVRLGPLGYGALRLGMTKEQALATGLLTPFVDSEGCDGAPIKAGGGQALLSPTLGIAAIQAGAKVATPEGVQIGTSLSALRRAYPGWKSATGDGDEDARGYAAVPGNSKAQYRIETRSSKVSSVTLQLVAQNCYE